MSRKHYNSIEKKMGQEYRGAYKRNKYNHIKLESKRCRLKEKLDITLVFSMVRFINIKKNKINQD